MGLTFELLGPERAGEVLFDLYDESRPAWGGETSGKFFEGKDRDCVCISHGVMLWQIVVGMEI